jgi:WD40 repeat protein
LAVLAVLLVGWGAGAAEQVPWQAGPDPQPAGLAATGGTKFALPLQYLHEVMFPTTPSPFFAIGANGTATQKRSIMDARTGKAVGRVEGTLTPKGVTGGTHTALDASGQYLATVGTQYGKQAETAIYVRATTSTAARKVVVPAELGIVKDIDFATGGRMLAYFNSKTGSTALQIAAFDVGTGQVAWSIQAGQGSWSGKQCLSPGRRFLAITTSGGDWTLSLYRTDTGACVGTIPLPQDVRGMRGLAFSPDGTQLAVLGQRMLRLWSMSDGQPSAELKLDLAGPLPPNCAAVEWLADERFLAVGGRFIVDRASGAVVHELPVHLNSAPAQRIVGGSWYLSYAPTPKNTYLLTCQQLNLETVAAAAAAVASGGSKEEAGLAAADEADLTGFSWDHQPGAGVGSAPADPLPTAAAAFLAQTVALKTDYGPQETAVLAAPGGRFALVCRAKAPGGPRQPGAAYLVDLTGTTPPQALSIPAQMQPLAVAANGKYGLFTAGERRIDVAALSPFKPVAAWRLPDTPEFRGDIRDAVLLEGNYALLRTGSHASLWQVPEKRAILGWQQEAPLASAVSPGGKYIVRGMGSLHLADARTGQPLVALSSPGRYSYLAFSADGSRLAGISQSYGSAELTVWDATTGQALRQVPCQATGDRLQFVHPDFVLLGNYLLQVATGAAVWRYDGQYYGLSAAAGRAWIGDGGGGVFRLAAGPLPHAAAAQAIAKRGAIALTPIIGPGRKAQLQLPDAPNANAERDQLIARLKRAGIEAPADGDLTLRVTRETKSLGTETFQVRGGRNATESVESIRITDTFTWVDSQGKVLWQTHSSTERRPPGMMLLKEGDSIQAYMERANPGRLSLISVPTLLLPPPETTILGTTRLSLK